MYVIYKQCGSPPLLLRVSVLGLLLRLEKPRLLLYRGLHVHLLLHGQPLRAIQRGQHLHLRRGLLSISLLCRLWCLVVERQDILLGSLLRELLLHGLRGHGLLHQELLVLRVVCVQVLLAVGVHVRDLARDWVGVLVDLRLAHLRLAHLWLRRLGLRRGLGPPVGDRRGQGGGRRARGQVRRRLGGRGGGPLGQLRGKLVQQRVGLGVVF